MQKTKKKDLRIQILEATRSLLVEDGLENISMRKIAARIGCKAPSIYYYFRNKDALIHALIDEGNERLYEILASLESEGTPLERLENNLRAFVAFGLEHPVFYQIMFLTRSEEIARFPKESFRKARLTLQPAMNILKDCVDQGLIKTDDLELTVVTNATMLHGFLSLTLMERLDRGWDKEQILDHIIDRLFAGMGIGGKRGARKPTGAS